MSRNILAQHNFFFSCECPPGYKGRNCSEKEYCYWYRCPAEASTCVTLSDGHECLANATFNGVNSTAIYTPAFSTDSAATARDKADSIVATFRTKTNGTVLQVTSNSAAEATTITITVLQSGSMEFEVPEGGVTRTYEYGSGLNDGAWHTAEVVFGDGGVISAIIDGGEPGQLTLDSSGSLLNYVTDSHIVVGSAFNFEASARDQYEVDSSTELSEVVDIRREPTTRQSLPLTQDPSQTKDHFR